MINMQEFPMVRKRIKKKPPQVKFFTKQKPKEDKHIGSINSKYFWKFCKHFDLTSGISVWEPIGWIDYGIRSQFPSSGTTLVEIVYFRQRGISPRE